MSVKQIIQESINKNPLGVKEALEEALRERVRAALEEKYAEMTESEDDDEDDEDDEDEDDMDESFDLSDFTVEELEDFMMSEDFDQLDEISKKTLGSYIKKAGQSSADLSNKSFDFMNKGMTNPDQKTAKAYINLADKKYAKSMTRKKYLDKAVDLLTK